MGIKTTNKTEELTALQLMEREQEIRRQRQHYHEMMVGNWAPPGLGSVAHRLIADFGTVEPQPPEQKLPMVKIDWNTEYLEDQIDRIIQNGDATVVIWKDKSKTVVKRAVDEEYNLYAAVAQAVMKKLMGSTSHAHKVIAKKVVVQKPKEKKVEVLQCKNLDNVQEAEIEKYEGEVNEAND